MRSADLPTRGRDGNVDHHGPALVNQAVLVNTGDLFLIATRGNFLDQFGRQQFAERTAHRIIASHTDQLFHASVPGLHSAFQDRWPARPR